MHPAKDAAGWARWEKSASRGKGDDDLIFTKGETCYWKRRVGLDLAVLISLLCSQPRILFLPSSKTFHPDPRGSP